MTEEAQPTTSTEAEQPAETPWPAFAAEQIAPGLHWLRIADDVWRTSFGAHIYIIGGPKEVILVDTGYEKPEPFAFAAGYLAGLGNPRVKAILLTHHHADHSEGAFRLRELTGAPIWCHALEAPLVTEATQREAKDDVKERAGTIVDGAIDDNQVIIVDGLEVQVVHTPGHSPGHCCFFLPASGTMLTGDLVLGSATTSVSPPHGDMVLLLRSLGHLLDFPMRKIAPAHGPIIEDPVENVQGILAHRREREQQVLDALAAGHTTPTAIVTAVYVDLEERLVELAGKQVTSILNKLERESRVVGEGEGEERQWRHMS